MEQECFVCSDWVGVLVGDERVGRPGWKGLLGDCLRKSRGGRGGDRGELVHVGVQGNSWLLQSYLDMLISVLQSHLPSLTSLTSNPD